MLLLLNFTRHHIMKGQQNFCVIIPLKGLQNFCSCRVSATSDHERGCRISAASDHLMWLQNFCGIGSFKGLPHFRAAEFLCHQKISRVAEFLQNQAITERGCRVPAALGHFKDLRISAASNHPFLGYNQNYYHERNNFLFFFGHAPHCRKE